MFENNLFSTFAPSLIRSSVGVFVVESVLKQTQVEQINQHLDLLYK